MSAHSNGLKSIPEGLLGLPKLTQLRLSDNELPELPMPSNLPALEGISLSYNQFDSDEVLRALKKLRPEVDKCSNSIDSPRPRYY